MSGSGNAGFVVGQMIGQIALPILIVVGGFVWANALSKKRDGFKPVRWPIYVCLTIALLAVLGQCSGSQKVTPAFDEMQAESAVHDVQVIDGAATQAFPDRLDRDALEQNRVIMTKAIEAEYAKDLGALESKISTVYLGGRTVILFEATGSNGSKLTHYIGVLDGFRKVVSCTSMDGSSIPACDKKAFEVFGLPADAENAGAEKRD